MKETIKKISIIMTAAVITLSQMSVVFPSYALDNTESGAVVLEDNVNDGTVPDTSGTDDDVPDTGDGPFAADENNKSAEGEGTNETAATSDDVDAAHIEEDEPAPEAPEKAEAETEAKTETADKPALSVKRKVSLRSGTTTYQDDDKKDLNDPGTTYVLVGGGSCRENGNFFTVPSNCSSEASPIVIILDNVNRSQDGKSPDSSFITINSGNYVEIRLRGNNYIRAGEDKQLFSSDDGMAGIHVSSGSTVKVTSESGDGSTDGVLEVHGGGGKYGGAGIGTRYNDDTGTVIIAGGTIRA